MGVLSTWKFTPGLWEGIGICTVCRMKISASSNEMLTARRSCAAGRREAREVSDAWAVSINKGRDIKVPLHPTMEGD